MKLQYKKSLFRTNDIYIVKSFKNRNEWLVGRGEGIGGSDASSTVNMNPWRSNLELWQIKTNRRTAPDISNNERVIYGQTAEEFIRRLYQLQHKDAIDVHYMPNVVLQNRKYPFMLYSPDGLLQEKDSGRCGILEIKTATPITATQREKWRDDRIPDNYFIQVLHGLNVTGFDFVDLVAELTYAEDRIWRKTYHLERDDFLEELEFVREGVEDFWNDYVVPDREPPLRLRRI